MADTDMKSATTDRRTGAVATEVSDIKAERQALKAQIAALQTIIDSITGATTLGDLRGFVKDVTRSVKRIAKILT